MPDDTAPWRLILDPPRDGFLNMALDEAMLESCRQGGPAPGAFPALRIYGWARPTLSLGRFQDALRSVDQGFCRDHGIQVVRRPTGGAAVLHDREVTYCLVGPGREPPFTGSLLESYRRIASGIAAGLSLLGLEPDSRVAAPRLPRAFHPAQCFARASSYEITFGGRKVVGSAQVRRRGASMQHGSILLDADPEIFDRATGGTEGEGRGWTTLEQLMGRKPSFEEVALALARGLGEAFGAQWKVGGSSPLETTLADRLRSGKYLDAHWTARGASTLSRT